MKAINYQQVILLFLASALAVGIFALDVLSPVDIVIGVLYLFPVFIVYKWARGKHLYLMTLLCTVLVLTGLLLPFPSPYFDSLINRVVQVAVLWVFAGLLSRQAQIEDQMRLQQGSLERQVGARTYRLQAEVDERKRAQKALSDSEALFRLMSELLPAPQCLARLGDDVILYANSAMAQMVGLSQAEIIGSRLTNRYLSPDLRTAILQQIVEDKVVRDVEIPFRQLNGEEGWCLYSAAGGTYRGEFVVLSVTFDITARKRMEQALVESENRYRLLADHSYDMIWTMNANGKITYMSPSVERIRGYTPDEAMRQPLDEIIKTPYVPLMRDLLRDNLLAAASGNPLPSRPFVCEQQHKNGTTVWTETITNTVFDADGSFVGLIGVTRDITERKRAEDALQRSEGKFAKVFHSSPAGLIISRLEDGTHIEVNDAYARIVGYSKSELVGHSSVDLGIVSAASRTDLVTAFRAKGFSIDGFDVELMTKSGAIKDAIISVEAINLNGESCLLSTMVDISERKQSEVALRTSAERLKLVLQNSVDMVAIYDHDGIAIYISPSVEMMFGIPQATALRIESRLRALKNDKGVRELTRELLIEAGVRPAELDFRLKTDDAVVYCLAYPSERVVIERQWTPATGGSRVLETVFQGFQYGEYDCEVISTTRDITDHKQLAETLGCLNDDLERRLDQCTEQLTTALAELERLRA